VNRFLRASRIASLALALGLLAAMARPALCAAPAPGAARLITLDAEDAPLPSVLKILAEKGDLNIITGVGATSTGRLTIHMKDVPLDQAVNMVVRAAGLAYERIGNSILVADPRALKEETGLSSYVVELKYADAADVKEALKSIASDIQVDKGGNRLVVVTSPRVISQIEEIVRVMDVPARQVLLEARILEVSTGDVMKLGIDWDRLNSQGFVIVEGGSGTAKQGAVPDSLPFYGSTGNYKSPWSSRPMTRQAFAWQTAIDLLIHEGKARVLASPKIATLNGREASILIGSRIPFVVTGTVFAGGGAAPVQRIEKEEVGIKLRITPLINADGYITTQITPEVSSVVDYKGSNADLPVVATRQASTTVRLKDGNSVIIGGLLSEEKTTNITKVPLLGDIPLLGFLFQHHSTSTAKRDLVIEVTPHIMPEQQ
jgi:type IV pilus secretin PilQ/predicted competence protein